jgi:hypothetical protein
VPSGNSKPSRQSSYRREQYARNNPPVRMPVDLSAFDEMISGIEEDISHALRPAAQAGAEVIYRAVIANVDKIGKVSGNLRGAIYQAFSEKESVAAPDGGYAKVHYDVSWNPKKAPHAHLIEYGHLQRYEMGYENGKFYGPIVRPEKRETPKPGRNASQSEKDAYWLPREGGPKQVPARPFMRPAFYRQGEAAIAVEAAFWKAMNK